mmetsp:Transcript_29978/g.90124  ORF Transcript_29978/g.90124 Transcript_29978/m.90124 type:complete len:213 (+) Transcript_29978:739-1377(+)
MQRLAIACVLSTAATFAPAARGLRPPLATREVTPIVVARRDVSTAAVALPGPEWNGCVGVMGGWLGVYYSYMWLSASVPADGSEAQKTWATRCFMNMGEQAPAFFAAFWTHAVFASPERAAACGAVYVATRVIYGVQRFWLKGGMTAAAGFGSTVPGYVINLYLMATAVARRCLDKPTFGASPWSPLAFAPACIACFLLAGKANEAVKKNFD